MILKLHWNGEPFLINERAISRLEQEDDSTTIIPKKGLLLSADESIAEIVPQFESEMVLVKLNNQAMAVRPFEFVKATSKTIVFHDRSFVHNMSLDFIKNLFEESLA